MKAKRYKTMAFFMLGGSVGGIIIGNMIIMVLCLMLAIILFDIHNTINNP